MSVELSPFDQVYKALWDMSLAHPGFNSLVKPGNRIRFDEGNRNPLKETVATADLPEVVLTSESINGNLMATSSSTSLRRAYTFIISTGDFRINELLHPVEWALFCAMVGWKEKLGALQWRGKKFCKNFTLTGATNGQSDPQQNRNITGWSTIWRCEIDMWFTTSDLLSEMK